jgi:thiol-disulfide isomerase/thioredoxin
MSPGLWILLGVGVAFAAMFAFQAWLSRMSRASEGREAAPLGPLGDAEGKLVWFHAPSCAPCRAMHAQVDALGERVIQVDVSQRPDLAQRYGVMATPTTVRVKGGVIVAARAGRLGPDALLDLLAL